MAMMNKIGYHFGRITKGKKKTELSPVEQTRLEMKQYANAVDRANVIKAQLTALNLRQSKLPYETLEARATPEQKPTDLEIFRAKMVKRLEDAPVTKLNTEDIDVYLKYFTDTFCEAVEQGRMDVFQHSRAALKKCLEEIRRDINASDERHSAQILDNRIQTCKSFEALIELGKSIDILKDNMEQSAANAEKYKASYETKLEELNKLFDTKEGKLIEEEIVKYSSTPGKYSPETRKAVSCMKEVTANEKAFLRERVEASVCEDMIREYNAKRQLIREQIKMSDMCDQKQMLEVNALISNLEKEKAERNEKIRRLEEENERTRERLEALDNDPAMGESAVKAKLEFDELNEKIRANEELKAEAERELNQERNQNPLHTNRETQAN